MSLSDRTPIAELPLPAERLRLRELFGITKTSIARELGVSRQTVWAWETGETEPTGINRERYARLLTSWAGTESQVRTLIEKESENI
jgi:DNA-binding XRE family transcriptional regulator